MPNRVLLAWPRGYCAGVERAVDTVDRALRIYGPPVYVRKQIVHNIHVVRDLETKGAVFVEEETEVPEGATVILSAHGVAPEVYTNSRLRSLNVIDATCPLVTKVHLEARRFARDGYTILLIGHEGHEEVVGTTGEAPEHIRLVGSPAEARTVQIPDPERVSYLSQTTLSVDETTEIIDVLRQRFPALMGPPRDDICYATQNRQEAVKDLARGSDVVLVIGSNNSSNSKRLVEVAQTMGTPAYLIDDETEIQDAWLAGRDTVGVTSGASAPEWLVERVIDALKARGAATVDQLRTIEEHMQFSLPAAVRTPLDPARIA
ncbi:MAG TPA: 4-hydroxy-3-methylbut-2-enyl diphosphate reductase [Actinobacteria bacterium]|nr:4-hydroxy-3-methylbut-2-enyl diphosphate reductase [Actinomycetota bacterium]HCP61746.1 4-hydroxy-3-methylbut-2-enyl diphosphate reductase [Actinomycetota bacterium]